MEVLMIISAAISWFLSALITLAWLLSPKVSDDTYFHSVVPTALFGMFCLMFVAVGKM